MEVSDVGPIHKGKVKLRPLTVFTGSKRFRHAFPFQGHLRHVVHLIKVESIAKNGMEFAKMKSQYDNISKAKRAELVRRLGKNHHLLMFANGNQESGSMQTVTKTGRLMECLVTYDRPANDITLKIQAGTMKRTSLIICSERCFQAPGLLVCWKKVIVYKALVFLGYKMSLSNDKFQKLPSIYVDYLSLLDHEPQAATRREYS